MIVESVLDHGKLIDSAKDENRALCNFTKSRQLIESLLVHFAEMFLKCKCCNGCFLGDEDFLRHNQPLRGVRLISQDQNLNITASDVSLRNGSDGEDTFDGYWDKEENGTGNEDILPKIEDIEGVLVGKVENEESEIVENLGENAGSVNSSKTIRVTDKKPVITKEKPRYECDICARVFVFKKSFQKHMAKHGKPDETIASATPEDSLKPKKTKTQPKQPTQCACQYCGKIFNRAQDCKYHEMSHRNERPHQCRHCPKSFARKPDLVRHEQRFHLGHKAFQCQYCEKAFSRKAELLNHEARHTGTRPYKCQFCDKTYITKRNRRVHEETHIQSPSHVKPSHQCSICAKLLCNKTALLLHEARHKGDKPHQCRYCEKRFVTASDRTLHERTHTGEKPFKCKYCDYASANQSSLLKHERSKHTGEWTSVCRFCGKGFTNAYVMRQHEAIHTGVKAFKCRYCEKSFRTYPKRKQHEYTHTGEKHWKCRYCDMRFNRKANCRKHENVHRNEPGYEPAPLYVTRLGYVGPEKRKAHPSQLRNAHEIEMESGAENSREPGIDGVEGPGTMETKEF